MCEVHSMIDGDRLVSVVVPAFNAAQTIQETLDSVSQQTYRALEVIVVDDGSTDETAAIVRRHSGTDPRFRVISKSNGGVASARNEGIRAGKGQFVAFIDADDLWHPTKIAKQLKALLSAGPDIALVYSPFRLIDVDGIVLASPHKYGVSGWVLFRHFHTNIVGNGSALLVRRKILEEFGGFDPSLRRHGAEGCEDLLLQLRIATRYQFGEVSEYLVGYRRIPGNMSSKAEQMVRSGMLAVNTALSECRGIRGLSADAMLKRYEWQRLKLTFRDGRARQGMQSFARQLATGPAFVRNALWADSLALANKLCSCTASMVLPRIGLRAVAADARRHFYDFDPKAGIDLDHNTATSRALRRLAKLDHEYRPKAGVGADQPARSSPDSPLTAFAVCDLDSSTYQEG
jgi:glycosyltransferase involved in cell wall biosynthesis